MSDQGEAVTLDDGVDELAVAASNQVTKAIREPRAWGEVEAYQDGPW